jgi:hypothetical protein
MCPHACLKVSMITPQSKQMNNIKNNKNLEASSLAPHISIRKVQEL